MRRPHRSRSKVALGAVGLLAVGTIAVLSVRNPGYTAQDVNLTQQTVWVTNASQLLVGRINKQVGELDSAVKVNGPFDVYQDGETVVILDGSKHELRPLDVVSVTLGGKISIPQRADVEIGGGVLAVADESSGAVWAGTPQALSALDPTATKPDVKVGPDVAVTVAQSGTVFAVRPGSADLWTLHPAGSSPDADGTAGPTAEPEASGSSRTVAGGTAATGRSATGPRGPTPLPGGALSPRASGAASPISITAVGNVPVVLDRAAGVLRLPARTVRIPDAATAVLQQSGPASDSVLVSTSTALLRIPLAQGAPQTVIAHQSGAPAAPVYLDGCAHAAWSSQPASYGLACTGARPAVRSVPGHTGAAAMVFRVNRHTIVLNDVETGATWSLGSDMKLINNWDEVKPLSQTTDNSTGDTGTESASDELTSSRANCTAGKVDPPAPAPDKYGVRAGRSTVLRVLDNDASSDCSMVVITGVDGWSGSGQGTVAVVDDGQALQATVPNGVTGELPPLTYHVSDGEGHSASARVTITVVPPDVHRPPVKLHDSSVPVESLGTVSYNVLSNYVSPDGDDLFLVSAAEDNASAGDEVSFQPDGLITFSDKGVGGAVKKTVNFVVSDGTDQVPGKLTMDVRPDGTAEPIASPVYSRAIVGRPVTMNILRSVIQPSVDATRLVAVTPIGKQPVTIGAIDQDGGTVTLTGTKPGTAYFTYQVSAGAKSAKGLLRLDTGEPSNTAEPPVAMMDVVYLPPGGVTTIDPTANDTDPMGNGLAVIQVQPDPRLSVTTENMQLVTISAQSVLPAGGVSVIYEVSNGADTVNGMIRVIPVPAHDPVPPTASDIQAAVRAGDAVTIPIAGHAVDPNGDVLTLTALGTDTVPANAGVLFHTASAIRYLAPKKAPAKPIEFSYTVTNSAGAGATGTATISVVNEPATVNHPPNTPAPVLARVFTGSAVSIPLPLDGIDPDGDWVSLDGITGPSASPLGEPTVADPSTIDYQAGDVPGYDSFTYSASDPYGGTTTGQVSVLVVAPPTTAQPPTAPNLTVSVRPGRVVGVNVLGMASAANGNAHLAFADPAFTAPQDWNVRIDKASGQLVIDTPRTDTVGSISYTVTNDSGLTGAGVLTVTVSATAKLQPPTAADIVVPADSIKPGQKAIDVTIPANKISDPGGTTADLVLSLDRSVDGDAVVTGDRAVRVPLTNTRQVLAYVVTNPDKATATAFIVVPPAGESGKPTAANAAKNSPLSVAPTGPKLSVKAGESVTIDISQHVRASDGAHLTVPNGSAPTVTGGGQIGRVDGTHVRYTAPKNGNGTVYVAFLVSDGTRDPVSVSLAVTVIPTAIPAPTVQSVSLTVEAGKSASQDVSRLVTAGNGGQQATLTYRISGGGDGFTAALSGSTLTVSATLSAKGHRGSFMLTATDGQGKKGSGTVTVTATGSTAPRLKISAITVTDGRPGKASTVNVLGAVTYNPFGKAPTVVAAAVQSGKGTVSAPGPTLQITPTAVGTVIVAFTLRDATGDPDRDVSGTATVTVQDKPGVPGTPTVVSMASKTVQLSWTAPTANGSPITGYTVTSGTFSERCGASPCTLKNLANGTAYQFVVVATNGIGTSLPSRPSAPATPDTAPNTPAAPTLTWTAKTTSLLVSWNDPGSDGTPVTSYDLQVSPADTTGKTQVTVTGGTNFTWKNLKFGQPYTFTVRAHNSSKTASGWSPASAPETPSTVPGAPTGVTVTFGPDNYNANGNTLSVSWQPPANDGGAALTQYRVNYSSSAGSDTITISDSSVTSTKIQGVQDGAQYTVSVVAVNRSGAGKVSSSASATPYSPPGTVTSVNAVAANPDSSVTVTWSAAANHGRPIDHYQVQWNGGSATADSTSYRATGLSYGTSYTFEVQACYANSVSFNTCGQFSSGASATPFTTVGSVTGPSASSGSGQVSFGWSPPGTNGRGPMSAQWLDGSGWHTGTSHTVGGACGSTVTLTVRGVDSQGLAGPESTLSGNTDACPPPEVVTVIRGSRTTACGSSCYYVDVALSGFPANARVNIYFNSKQGDFSTGSWNSNQTFQVDGNGNLGDTRSYAWYGYPTGWVSATATAYGVSGTKNPWGP